jgi:hypothetical protein
VVISWCSFSKYSNKIQDVWKLIFQNLCDSAILNQGWDSLSAENVGPHGLVELILKTVRPSKIALTIKACLCANADTYSTHMFKCKKATELILRNKCLPDRWSPSYLSFFRAAGGSIQIAANFHLPQYFYSFDIPPYRPWPKAPRPRSIRALLFNARISFIDEIAPYIHSAEVGFNNMMNDKQIKFIGHDDGDLRRFLFDVDFIGSQRHAVYPTHLWAHALHLRHKRQPIVEWGHPCARCELINKGMYSWNPSGDKCSDWRNEYPVLNCGESLALAMVISHDRNGDLENSPA